MNDFELLKCVHNKLPPDYKKIQGPYLKRYSQYIVQGGHVNDDRAKQIFKQYWVGYFIYHYQVKAKEYDFWELNEKPYEEQLNFAKKMYEMSFGHAPKMRVAG
ncbi:hypothetical protein [Enterococcus hailinensis]|uniref:hypothetical protein n=1 Tax=Enterococcus hailinensis TaxID=3238988 RepID=UPI0038B2BCE4